MKDIPVVQRIRTGWAVKAASKGVQQKLVEMGREFTTKTGALEVCKPEVWSIYAIPNVPYQQHDLARNVYTADQCITQEVAIETGVEPSKVKFRKRALKERPVQLHGSLLLTNQYEYFAYSEAVPHRMRLKRRHGSMYIVKGAKVTAFKPGATGTRDAETVSQAAEQSHRDTGRNRHILVVRGLGAHVMVM
jgi:hypothetical protein